MKMTIFSSIQSLEDIHKQKLRLRNKLRLTEKSISKKSSIVDLLFKKDERISSFFDEKNNIHELINYVLPLGLKYLLKIIRNNTNRKPNKRVLIYTILGSVSALLVYLYMGNLRKPESPENK